MRRSSCAASAAATAGEWTLVGLAGAPGGFVRSAICAAGRRSAPTGATLTVPGGVARTPTATSCGSTWATTRGSTRASPSPDAWPRRALRRASASGHLVPGLGQYWHPHLLGARVDGELRARRRDWTLRRRARLRGEELGRRLPRALVVGPGQRHRRRRRRLRRVRGRRRAASARCGWRRPRVVVRLGRRPAAARPAVRARADRRQRRRAGGCARGRPRHTVELEGDANGSVAAPPARAGARPSGALIDGAAQHFTGRLRVTRRARPAHACSRGESELAALERGDLSPASADARRRPAAGPRRASFSRCASSVTPGGEAQHGRLVERHVVPGGVEQLVARARARGERVEHPPLAFEPVLDVLVDLRARVPDERPVPGRDHLRGRARAAAAASRGRPPSRRRRARRRRCPRRARCRPRTATRRHSSATWSGAWPGVGDRLERPDVARRRAGGSTSTAGALGQRPARPRSGRGGRGSARCRRPGRPRPSTHALEVPVVVGPGIDHPAARRRRCSCRRACTATGCRRARA